MTRPMTNSWIDIDGFFLITTQDRCSLEVLKLIQWSDFSKVTSRTRICKNQNIAQHKDRGSVHVIELIIFFTCNNRLSILEKSQIRLSKLDELRLAAKTGAEMRFEKERNELDMKVQLRGQQAEANRMLHFKAYKQRREARRDRAAQSLMQRMMWERRYKECLHASICQKLAAVERRRLRLLEEEKARARHRILQERQVSKSVHSQREIERTRIKVQLEDRLERVCLCLE